jgi:putative flippase GtrA
MQKIIKAFMSPQFLRYLAVGFTTFGLDFGIYYIFVKIGAEAIAANLIAVFVSLIFNFTVTNYWTFKGGNSKRITKLSKYVVLAVFNYIANNAIIYLLTAVLMVNPLLAKVIVTGLQVSWTFVAYKLWIFTAND